MQRKFYKLEGAGNDFVFIDDRCQTFSLQDTSLIKRLCNRRYGIGADGLVVLRPSAQGDCRGRFERRWQRSLVLRQCPSLRCLSSPRFRRNQRRILYRDGKRDHAKFPARRKNETTYPTPVMICRIKPVPDRSNFFASSIRACLTLSASSTISRLSTSMSSAAKFALARSLGPKERMSLLCKS